MKKIFFAASLGLLLGLSVFFCAQSAQARTELVNTQLISLQGVTSIQVEYIAETVQVVQSANQELVLREYMSDDKRSYFADISRSGSKLTIEAGDRPWIGRFDSRVVLEIPASYMGALSVSTVSGKIEMQSPWAFSQLTVGSVSGSIDLASLTVANLKASSTSGKISLANVIAQMNLESISGSVELTNCRGLISIVTTSGKIDVSLDQLLGGLDLKSISGKINLRIPANSGYDLLATSTSGNIRLDLNATLVEQGREARARTEIEPRQEIRLRTTSGGITVKH